MATMHANLHEESDEQLPVRYTTYDAGHTMTPYVELGISDVTFFLHNPDTLLALGVAANNAYAELHAACVKAEQAGWSL